MKLFLLSLGKKLDFKYIWFGSFKVYVQINLHTKIQTPEVQCNQMKDH